MRSIAVVGGGCAGAFLTVQLLRQSRSPLKITLFEPRQNCANGLAYSTTDPRHFLNVPAAKMSAFPDEPEHFLNWARNFRAPPEEQEPVAPGSFLSRALYGKYAREIFESALKHFPQHQVVVRHESVRAIENHEQKVRVSTVDGGVCEAEKAVLAVGNWCTATPYKFLREETYKNFYRHDIWTEDLLGGLDPKGTVLILGAGLTMVDVVLSMHFRRHRGPIVVISRRGLSPRAHAIATGKSSAIVSSFEQVNLPPRRLLRELRRRATAAMTDGAAWQQVVDSVRPFTQRVWMGWTIEEKQKFLRHLQAFWDIHRHRAAPQVHEELGSLLQSQRLSILSGRIVSVEIRGKRLEVSISGRSGERKISAARILNCTGQQANPEEIDHALVRQLLASGAVRPGPCGLGLDTHQSGALLSRAGAVSKQLYSIGSLRKGNLWESTAIPEIRVQAAELAKELLA